MVERQRAVAAIIAQDPNVRSFMSSVGGGGPRSTANTGSLNLILKPRNERALSADEIIQELRPKLAAVPGIRVYMQNPPAIRIGGQQTSAGGGYMLLSFHRPAMKEPEHQQQHHARETEEKRFMR